MLEMPASWLHGIFTYWRWAKLSHLPSILITESSTPLVAAVVAAPILKLWPQYCPNPRPPALNPLALHLQRADV